MLVLGLTGGIAMGKSHCARLLRGFGIPVFDSDAVVHELYASGGPAVAPVLAAFPGVADANGGIDRGLLGTRVVGDAQALRRLEAIVHALVRGRQVAFLRQHARLARRLVVLDIPLLFETGGEARCDAVLAVSASAMLQRERALRRPGMTPAKLAAILRQQMPDARRRVLADFLVMGGHDRGAMAAQLKSVLVAMRRRTPRAWPDYWFDGRAHAPARFG